MHPSLTKLTLAAALCAGCAPRSSGSSQPQPDGKPVQLQCPWPAPAPELATVDLQALPSPQGPRSSIVAPPPGVRMHIEQGLGPSSSPRMRTFCGWLLNPTDQPLQIAMFPFFGAEIDASGPIQHASLRHSPALEPPPPRLFSLPARSKALIQQGIALNQYNWSGTPQARVRWRFEWGVPAPQPSPAAPWRSDVGEFFFSMPPPESLPHDPPPRGPGPTMYPG